MQVACHFSSSFSIRRCSSLSLFCHFLSIDLSILSHPFTSTSQTTPLLCLRPSPHHSMSSFVLLSLLSLFCISVHIQLYISYHSINTYFFHPNPSHTHIFTQLQLGQLHKPLQSLLFFFLLPFSFLPLGHTHIHFYTQHSLWW